MQSKVRRPSGAITFNPSIQSIKLRITFPELMSSELDGGVPVRQR